MTAAKALKLSSRLVHKPSAWLDLAGLTSQLGGPQAHELISAMTWDPELSSRLIHNPFPWLKPAVLASQPGRPPAHELIHAMFWEYELRSRLCHRAGPRGGRCMR